MIDPKPLDPEDAGDSLILAFSEGQPIDLEQIDDDGAVEPVPPSPISE